MARKSKYNNKKVVIDGITFDSRKEGNHYNTLKTLEKSGKISNLQTHVTYRFIYNNVKIGSYVADFTYIDEDNNFRVEDVKGWDKKKQKFITTAMYNIKKKMMKAFYNIDVVEV
ncbi:MAG: DUF1064 domain-containing protein [Aquiluna sp.]